MAFINYLKTKFAKTILYIMGWSYDFKGLSYKQLTKQFPKAIIFGEPHTSLWDIVLMKLFFWYYGAFDIVFPVNSKYFKYTGYLLHNIGAFPVQVSQSTGLTNSLIELYNETDELYLHIAPSGTRKNWIIGVLVSIL